MATVSLLRNDFDVPATPCSVAFMAADLVHLHSHFICVVESALDCFGDIPSGSGFAHSQSRGT